jgi:hypothetical protein
MAFAFDTLSYSKRLQNSGVSPSAGRAHAEAARETELVTKTDLSAAVGTFKTEIENTKLSLTIRLGSMIGAGIAALAVLQRFH